MRNLRGIALGMLAALLAAPALAADLGVVMVDRPAEPELEQVASVTGFYAGINLGQAIAGTEYTDLSFDPVQTYDLARGTPVMGVSIGYDLLIAPRFVAGVELRYDYLNISIAPFSDAICCDLLEMHDSTTAVVKLGYLMAPGTQIYAVAGVGQTNITVPVGTDEFISSPSNGYVFGIGAETLVANNISASVDARYFRASEAFGTRDLVEFVPKYFAITAGLKVRFGGDATAVADLAETDFDFTGFNASLGLVGAVGDMSRPISTPGAEDGGWWGQGLGAGIGIGYDTALNDTLILGVDLSADYAPMTFYDPDANSPDVGATTAFANVDGVIAASLKIGTKVNPSSMIYAKVGAAAIYTTANEDFFALDGGGSVVLPGYQVSVGVESALTDDISLDVSGSYTAATESLVTENTQLQQVELIPSLLSGKAAVKYHF